MKRKVIVAATVLMVVFAISSCKTSNDCPAYSQTKVERAGK